MAFGTNPIIYARGLGDRIYFARALTCARSFCRGSDRVQSHQRRTKGQTRASRPVSDVGRRLAEFGRRRKFVFAATAPAAAAATAADDDGDVDPQTSVRYDRDGRRQRRYRHVNPATLAPGLVHVQPVTDELGGLTAAPRAPTNALVVAAATGARPAAGARQGQEPEEEQEQVAGQNPDDQVPRVQGTAERAQVTKSKRQLGGNLVRAAFATATVVLAVATRVATKSKLFDMSV